MSFKNWLSQGGREEAKKKLKIRSAVESKLKGLTRQLTVKHFDVLKDFNRLLFKEKGDLNRKIPLSLYFFTRPFTMLDLTFMIPNWMDNYEVITAFNTLYYPGIETQTQPSERNGNIKYLSITQESIEYKDPRMALTSHRTEEKSWVADVMQRVEPDGSRFIRILKAINSIFSCGEQIDYVVFPELSVPQNQLKYIALQLRKKGISLICGLSYNHLPIKGELDEGNGFVNNELAYVLFQRIDGFVHQYVIKQQKEIAAIGEEQELWNVGGLSMKSDKDKYIINHNGFVFSGLICNELLNIDYRQQLRGEIDMLVIPEWNKDLETYESLVETTANDLHCFVA